MELSRVDRVLHTIDPAKLAATGLTITGVTVALLPVRSAPTSGTVWSALTSYTAPTTAKIMLSGPDASSVGALPVTADCDLWALVTDGTQTEAVKIERINLEGSSGTITPLPPTYVTSVNGKSGVATLTFSDVGADASGAATAAQAAAISAAATDATTKANAAQAAATAAIPSMSTIAADPALKAAYVPFKSLALNPDLLIAGAITRDVNGAATSAPVVWPDGTAGTYTADTVSTAFPGAVDAYHITYGSPATKTYTQPAVTRDATGAVTTRPALTVA